MQEAKFRTIFVDRFLPWEEEVERGMEMGLTMRSHEAREKRYVLVVRGEKGGRAQTKGARHPKISWRPRPREEKRTMRRIQKPACCDTCKREKKKEPDMR